MYDRRRGIDSIKDEAIVSEVDREPNDLGLVAHLGRAEQRYSEIDARRARTDRSGRSAA